MTRYSILFNRRQLLGILGILVLPSCFIYVALVLGVMEVRDHPPALPPEVIAVANDSNRLEIEEAPEEGRRLPSEEPGAHRSDTASFEVPKTVLLPTVCAERKPGNWKWENFSGDRKISLIIAVISAFRNRLQRDAIRQTWGSVDALQFGDDVTTRLVFVVGRIPPDIDVSLHLTSQDTLEAENGIHSDILQGDFSDTYANLTLKTLTALEWFDVRCHSATSSTVFLLKIDDDCFLNPLRFRMFFASLADVTGRTTTSGPAIYGRVLANMEPHRNPDSKWFVSPDEYPGSSYPNFTTGPAYLITGSAVTALRAAAPRATRLHLEDVFLTGIVAAAAGVPRVDVFDFIGKASYIRDGLPVVTCSKLKRHSVVHGVQSASDMRTMWQSLLDSRTRCF